MLSTALTTALPQIMEDFSLNAASSGQWLTSIYSLVMGILVLCTAYLIKRFPTKNLYISSLLLFSIGVVLNGFAQSFTVMMLGRIMQAAGIIVDHWGWRIIFYSLAVLCIIALVVFSPWIMFWKMNIVNWIFYLPFSQLLDLPVFCMVSATSVKVRSFNFQPVFRSVFDHIPSHNFRCARQHHLYVFGGHTGR